MFKHHIQRACTLLKKTFRCMNPYTTPTYEDWPASIWCLMLTKPISTDVSSRHNNPDGKGRWSDVWMVFCLCFLFLIQSMMPQLKPMSPSQPAMFTVPSYWGQHRRYWTDMLPRRNKQREMQGKEPQRNRKESWRRGWLSVGTQPTAFGLNQCLSQ